MSTPISLLALVVLAVLAVKYLILDPLILSPLSRIPGPKSYALTKWRLALEDARGTTTRTLASLHAQLGDAVRIGPDRVSFNSLSAVRAIYGPGTPFGRTSFYRTFDVYGCQNLFTFHSAAAHGQRKKLVSHAYSKSALLGSSGSGSGCSAAARMAEAKTAKYLSLIESEPDRISDVFASLHYYSLDSITDFLYGAYGATEALGGNESHRALIGDMLDPTRRRLSWAAIHMPALTRWLYSRTGIMEKVVKPVLPMQKPATYTGIREHAMLAVKRFQAEGHPTSGMPSWFSSFLLQC